MSGASNYGSCPAGAAYDSTNKNCAGDGDGDGDGDTCEPVTRTFVTSVIFDSLADLLLGTPATPLPIAWPTIAASPVQLAQWNVLSTMGSTTADGVAGEISVGLDTAFETTLNMNIDKPSANASDLRVQLIADYGPAGDQVVGTWDFGIGGSSPDELVALSFSCRVPSASAIGGPAVPPTVRAELTRIGGNNNAININRADWYTKQCLPIIESLTIENCESTVAPSCPNLTRILVSEGGNPPVSWDWTVPDPPIVVGDTAPVFIIFEFDGPLPDIPGTTVSPPNVGPISWNPGTNQLSWTFSQPSGDTFPKVTSSTCEYEFADPTTTGVP